MSEPTSPLTFPKLMVICMVASAGVLVLLAIIYLWGKLGLGRSEPLMQGIVVSAAILVFFIFVSKVAKERW